MIKHSKPTVVLFSDASVYDLDCVAGWGGWFKSDNSDAQTVGGPILPYNANSSICEIWAIAHTIEAAIEQGAMTTKDQSIMIQSDSLNALSFLSYAIKVSYTTQKGTGCHIIRAKKVKDRYWPAIRRVRKLLGSRQVVYLRHVRSHEEGATSRSSVNEICDERAKTEARKQIKLDGVEHNGMPV